MRYASPLRYPGGKAILADFLADIIDMNDLRGCDYYESYAGGAGAALHLLKDDVVSELYLNDADVRIYAFWWAVLNHTDRFVEQVLSVPLTIAEWKRHQEICLHPSRHSLFDVGFAAMAGHDTTVVFRAEVCYLSMFARGIFSGSVTLLSKRRITA